MLRRKVLCIIYPSFSYEITLNVSTLVLSSLISMIDYVASENWWWSLRMVCPVNRRKHWSIHRRLQVIFARNGIGPKMRNWSRFWEVLMIKITLSAISSALPFIGESRLAERYEFTGGIWQNFFDYFEFLPRGEFPTESSVQDKQIITAITCTSKNSKESDSLSRFTE